MEVRYHRLAQEELTAAALFYHEQAVGLGADFLDAVARAEQLVAQYPLAGRVLRGELRRFPVRRFPYDLVYFAQPEVLFVLAVAHQRRKPEYWVQRQAR